MSDNNFQVPYACYISYFLQSDNKTYIDEYFDCSELDKFIATHYQDHKIQHLHEKNKAIGYSKSSLSTILQKIAVTTEGQKRDKDYAITPLLELRNSIFGATIWQKLRFKLTLLFYFLFNKEKYQPYKLLAKNLNDCIAGIITYKDFILNIRHLNLLVAQNLNKQYNAYNIAVLQYLIDNEEVRDEDPFFVSTLFTTTQKDESYSLTPPRDDDENFQYSLDKLLLLHNFGWDNLAPCIAERYQEYSLDKLRELQNKLPPELLPPLHEKIAQQEQEEREHRINTAIRSIFAFQPLFDIASAVKTLNLPIAQYPLILQTILQDSIKLQFTQAYTLLDAKIIEQVLNFIVELELSCEQYLHPAILQCNIKVHSVEQQKFCNFLDEITELLHLKQEKSLRVSVINSLQHFTPGLIRINEHSKAANLFEIINFVHQYGMLALICYFSLDELQLLLNKAANYHKLPPIQELHAAVKQYMQEFYESEEFNYRKLTKQSFSKYSANYIDVIAALETLNLDNLREKLKKLSVLELDKLRTQAVSLIEKVQSNIANSLLTKPCNAKTIEQYQELLQKLSSYHYSFLCSMSAIDDLQEFHKMIKQLFEAEKIISVKNVALLTNLERCRAYIRIRKLRTPPPTAGNKPCSKSMHTLRETVLTLFDVDFSDDALKSIIREIERQLTTRKTRTKTVKK